MERLTHRYGNNHAVPTKIVLDFVFDMGKETFYGLTEIFDRLSAYEDTGLEPEEIPLVAEMQRQLEAYLALGTVEHLTELVKAEREGRVAERPIVRCGECAQYLAKPCFCAANGTEWFPRDFCSYGTAGHEAALEEADHEGD